MKTINSISALAFLCISLTASADTVIEFKYDDKLSQFLTNGKMARINSRGSDDYMIVNFNTRSIYSVAPKDKQITSLSSSAVSTSSFKAPEIRSEIKPAGPGPVIAGYKTNKYRLSADGDFCGNLFASKEALTGSPVENMFGTLKAMTESHLQSLPADSSDSACHPGGKRRGSQNGSLRPDTTPVGIC